MQCLYLALFSVFVYYAQAQSLVQDAKYNNKELRCLVCQKSIEELEAEIKKIDPESTVDVGGYRLDAEGNYNHKTVSMAKSEIHLSEMMETVCKKMDNYVRALWKSNGTLTLFTMLSPDGTMNGDFDSVDLIQDMDLNESLKYYCEGIVEEYEEILIKLYQQEAEDVKTRFCFTETGVCPASADYVTRREEL
ncbi:hypothetical protein NQ315_007234 [Exocentrus adspersus]|uniref:DUF3456 domain-containing protein n=1 Tax=Exocentrus adspersus TaxID=1586481 RepID=A0AAV8WDP2_9CUCU|nr:hypothetical protein NQ315_007234 [Exocentrus adspersus]